jgi:hypothetical protein
MWIAARDARRKIAQRPRRLTIVPLAGPAHACA